MSYRNYQEAVELFSKCENYCHGNGVSPEVITKAEKLLGLHFSNQLTEYLTTYGYIDFFGVELYGIVDPELSSEEIEGCMVEWALAERENNSLNPNWLPICFEDDGCMAFLDFENCNANGEPQVILAEDTGNGYEMTEEIAEDLGEYMLQLAEM